MGMSCIAVCTTEEEKEVAYRCKNFSGSLYVAFISRSAWERMGKARHKSEEPADDLLPDRTRLPVGGFLCTGKMGDRPGTFGAGVRKTLARLPACADGAHCGVGSETAPSVEEGMVCLEKGVDRAAVCGFTSCRSGIRMWWKQSTGLHRGGGADHVRDRHVVCV